MGAAMGLARVGSAQVPRVAALLARAFEDDPLMDYAMPDPAARARLLPKLIGLNVRYGQRYGEVYATAKWEGAAVWLPPRRTRYTPWRMLRAGMFAAPLAVDWAVLRRLSVVENYTARLHRLHAPREHWYLSQIGVEPNRQGQGIGSALLRPMLARMDAQSVPCYLETEKAANVSFYRKHGFTVVADGDAVAGGPHVWAMVRTPNVVGGTGLEPVTSSV